MLRMTAQHKKILSGTDTLKANLIVSNRMTAQRGKNSLEQDTYESMFRGSVLSAEASHTWHKRVCDKHSSTEANTVSAQGANTYHLLHLAKDTYNS